MQKIGGEKQIYLSGGGDEHKSFPLDKFFLEKIPQNGSFLYIPIALRKHKLFLNAPQWLKEVLKLHKRTDLKFETLLNSSTYTLEQLKTFDSVYIGGGDTTNLINEINTTGFSKILIEFIKFGGLVYGGSAGAIIMGKRINVIENKNYRDSVNKLGLNLLYGFSVVCHYKKEQNKQIKSWAINNKLSVMCLTEESGLVIENSSVLCCSTKPVDIFTPDGKKTKVYPGKYFNLKNKKPLGFRMVGK